MCEGREGGRKIEAERGRELVIKWVRESLVLRKSEGWRGEVCPYVTHGCRAAPAAHQLRASPTETDIDTDTQTKTHAHT